MVEKPVLKEFEADKGVKSRWIAITALLLAVGAILHLITPSFGGITPNWTIAMYCIAINLTRPTVSQAAGIGVVAGALNIPTSKSAFPYGNLASELVGAVTCAIIVHTTVSCTVGKLNLKPAVTAFLSTITSGFTFITILKVVMSLPMHVYLYAMVPVVFAVAAINTVVTQLLYFPAQKLLHITRGQM